MLRLVHFFKNEYIPNKTVIIDPESLKANEMSVRRKSRIISLDLEDNLNLRYHDNIKKARLDILELLDLKIEFNKANKPEALIKSFTGRYISASPYTRK